MCKKTKQTRKLAKNRKDKAYSEAKGSTLIFSKVWKWDTSIGWSKEAVWALQCCSLVVPHDWLLQQSIGGRKAGWNSSFTHGTLGVHRTACQRKLPIEPYLDLKTLNLHTTTDIYRLWADQWYTSHSVPGWMKGGKKTIQLYTNH